MKDSEDGACGSRSKARSVRNEARSASLRPLASSSVNEWLLVSGRFQTTTGGCLLQSHMKDTSGVGKEDWLVFGEGDAIGTGADVYGFEGTVAQRNITVTGSYCICCGTLTDLTACRQVLIVCLSRKDSVEVTKRGYRCARKRNRCDHATYLSIYYCCVTRKSPLSARVRIYGWSARFKAPCSGTRRACNIFQCDKPLKKKK